jgi:hypothetical protein
MEQLEDVSIPGCPLCGASSGWSLGESQSFRYWDVLCNACGERVTECRSDKRTSTGSELPTQWPAADDVWREACRHVETLRADLAEEQRLNAMGAEREARLMAQVFELRREVERLRATKEQP